jgi:hypothetical protein
MQTKSRQRRSGGLPAQSTSAKARMVFISFLNNLNNFSLFYPLIFSDDVGIIQEGTAQRR